MRYKKKKRLYILERLQSRRRKRRVKRMLPKLKKAAQKRSALPKSAK